VVAWASRLAEAVESSSDSTVTVVVGDDGKVVEKSTTTKGSGDGAQVMGLRRFMFK